MSKVGFVLLMQKKQDAITGQFEVTVDGKLAYTPFPYNTLERMREMEKLAKACAFDEACRVMFKGQAINISYSATTI